MVIALVLLASFVAFIGSIVLIAKSQRPTAVTVRRELKKLPVLRNDGTQRILALCHLAERRCDRCAHFDLRQGQDAIAANPAFKQVTSHLAPAQMGLTAKGEMNSSDNPGLAPAFVAKPWRWEEFGACLQHSEVRHGGDSCEKWG